MPTFIERLAAHLVDTDVALHQQLVLLPNQRAEIFLREALRPLAPDHAILPLFSTVDNYISAAAELVVAEPLVLLMELFRAYEVEQGAAFPEKESEGLGAFLNWGQMLLSDFGEIDRYLLPPENVLGDLYNVQKLNEWNLSLEDETPLMRRYSDFISLLPSTYTRFTSDLLQRGEAYSGLASRHLAEHPELTAKFLRKNGIRRVVIAGLNALNTAELTILQHLREQCPTTTLWDLDPHYVDLEDHEAGHFLRAHRDRQRVFGPHTPSTKGMESDWRTLPKTIKLIGASQYSGQARAVAHTLQEWHDRGIPARDMAVILADESLLTPVLNFLPEAFEKVNITMGYPLDQTGLAGTVRLWIDVVEYAVKNAKNPEKWTFYYRSLSALFTDPTFNAVWTGTGDGPEKWVREIVAKNRVFTSSVEWSEKLAPGGGALAELLQPTSGLGFIDRLQAFLRHTGAVLASDPMIENTAYHLHTLLEQLRRTLGEEAVEPLILLRLIKQLLRTGTIDFVGEPLEGLQIMGILESRTLDFPYVLLVGVNEGVLPAGRSYNSLLPYDIKRHYGLPTFEEKDAVYAYHFYRIQQRCKESVITFNTDRESVGGGEPSRFLVQLEVELKGTAAQVLPRIYHQGPIRAESMEARFRAERSPAVVDAIKSWMSRGISASALGQFLRDPDLFYQRRLVRVQEEDAVEESISSLVMGSLVHKGLELLYTPYLGRPLPKFDVDEWTDQALDFGLNYLIDEHHYTRASITQGRNLITVEVCRTMLRQFLTYERARLDRHEVVVLALEKELTLQLPHPDLDLTLKFNGVVDRLEKVDGELHIWDYKTGNIGPSDLSLGDLSDLWKDSKTKALQVVFYAWLLDKDPDFSAPLPWKSGLFKLQSPKPEVGLRGKAFGPGGKIDRDVLEQFEQELLDFLYHMVHATTPFEAIPRNY